MSAQRRRRGSSSRPTAPRSAPGALEIVQAFVNTTTPEDKRDELAFPDDLSRWLSRRGLLSPGTELGEADLARAVAVREGLRALIRANGDHELDVDAARQLGRMTDGARFRLVFEAGEPTGFEPVSRNLDDALGALAGIVVTARLEGVWPLLKACERRGCQRIFYDFSKNRGGKWCTPQCGERIRSRNYRKMDKYKDRPKPLLRF